MAQYIKNANIFGRLGTGLGKGINEQLPKEVERNRLASGLKNLGEQKNLSPFQQFTGLVGAAHEYPQIVESGGNLLRQKAIIDSLQPKQQPQGNANNIPNNRNISQSEPNTTRTATTTKGTEARLNPYIPPSGEQKEIESRQLMANEPHVYPNIESARAAINQKVASDIDRSNSQVAASRLEEEVQDKTEGKIGEEIRKLGANVPGTVLSILEKKAVNDVVEGKLSPDEAKEKYGKDAHQISRDISTMKGWGGLNPIVHSSKDLFSSIKNMSKKFKEKGLSREFADLLIAENDVTPAFAYANAVPVSDIKSLNDQLKSLPNIKPKTEKIIGAGPGLAGVGFSAPKVKDREEKTQKIIPSLAKSMGKEGSPMAVAYELDNKGYDSQLWKDYLIDNQKELDLSVNQVEELSKTNSSYFSWLNDWFLKTFSGIK